MSTAAAGTVELGDAGEAVDNARQIDFNTVTIKERRAVVWVDIARAFGQRANSQKPTP